MNITCLYNYMPHWQCRQIFLVLYWLLGRREEIGKKSKKSSSKDVGDSFFFQIFMNSFLYQIPPNCPFSSSEKMRGNMRRNMRGNMRRNIRGNMRRNMRGNMRRNMSSGPIWGVEERRSRWRGRDWCKKYERWQQIKWNEYIG